MMKKISLFPILFVYFVDHFSLAIVFPLFSALLLTDQFAFFSLQTDLSTRSTLLRILNAAFPFALLFGAPIMGNFSDYLGRKRTFSITISATVVGNLLTAVGIYLNSIPLLIFSRMLAGFFAGNLALCLASISDLSQSMPKRTQYFGYLVATGGLSWTLAMSTGGDLIGSLFHTELPPETPFFIAALLGCINLLFLFFFFSDPIQATPTSCPRPFRALIKTLCTPKVRTLYLTQGLFLLAWLLIFQGFASYSTTTYHLETNRTASSLLLIGLSWIMGSSLLNKRLLHFLPSHTIPLIGLATTCLLLFAASFINHLPLLVLFDCLIALIASFTSANLLNLISFTADVTTRGKIMGLSQTVYTLAQMCTALTGALFPNRGYFFIYQTAAVSMLAALITFFCFQSRKKPPKISKQGHIHIPYD